MHLIGYNLNETLCRAFEESCRLIPTCINHLLLENNGLYDKGLSVVLEGVNHLTSIKKFVVKN